MLIEASLNLSTCTTFLINYRPGSIIADVDLIYNMSSQQSLFNPLLEAISAGVIGDFSVSSNKSKIGEIFFLTNFFFLFLYLSKLEKLKHSGKSFLKI